MLHFFLYIHNPGHASKYLLGVYLWVGKVDISDADAKFPANFTVQRIVGV